MVRVESLIVCLLLVGLAPRYSGANPETLPASEGAAVQEKLAPGLAKALTEAPSSPGIAIAVTLRKVDLPPPGAARRADISARQQRVLRSGKNRLSRCSFLAPS